MESPARYPVLCKKALKIALNIHRKQTVIDAVKFRLVLSHNFARSLWLEMLTGNKACNLEQVFFPYVQGSACWPANVHLKYDCLIEVLNAICILGVFSETVVFPIN